MRWTPCWVPLPSDVSNWPRSMASANPIFLKIAPDLEADQVAVIAATLEALRHR